MPGESIPPKPLRITRTRPPRVKLTYPIEPGPTEGREIAFVVGVIGDFSGEPTEPMPPLQERKFVDVNPDNFDVVMERVKPRVAFAVANRLDDDPTAAPLHIDFSFRNLRDFGTENVLRQTPLMNDLLEKRTGLAGRTQMAESANNERVSPDVEELRSRVTQIDQLLSLQLNDVMHHEQFQQLEAAWRGLRWLVDHSETSANLKIRGLTATRHELLHDPDSLYRQVYAGVFDTFGEDPFGVLIGNYEFGPG